jgi:hypothetical protein
MAEVAFIDGKTVATHHKNLATNLAKAQGALAICNRIQTGTSSEDGNDPESRRSEEMEIATGSVVTAR